MESHGCAELKIDSYQQALKNAFGDDTADVEFRFPKENDQKRNIQAHRKWLAAISPVFRAMFDGNWIESDVVNIEDTGFYAFGGFIEVLYGAHIEIGHFNVTELMNLVRKYQVDQLVPRLSESMEHQLSTENVVEYFNVALIYELDKLRDECKKLISECTEDVLKTDAFLSCDAGTLKAILELEQVFCAEAKIFDGCIEWAKRKCKEMKLEANGDNLREQLGDCFALIRFKDMENRQFVKRCKRYEGEIFSRHQLCDLMVHFHGNKVVDNKRQGRLPQLTISKIASDEIFQFKFRSAKLKEAGRVIENRIRFSTSETMELVQVNYGKLLSIASNESLEPTAKTLSYELKENGEVIKSFDIKSTAVGTQVVLNDAKSTIEKHQVYEMNLIFSVDGQEAPTYGLDHVIESQTLGGVDLVIKKDIRLRDNGVALISGLGFKKINA